MLGDDAGHDHDEGAGRAADLTFGAAERRDEEAGDDRAVDPGLRRHAGRDGERHRQRQRDQADGHPGDQVGEERPDGIAREREDEAGAQRSKLSERAWLEVKTRARLRGA